MKNAPKVPVSSYMIEFVVYAVLVIGYYFLVLHLLGDWLFDLFQRERNTYAFVALGLIAGQGILLELVTSGLLRLIRPAREAE